MVQRVTYRRRHSYNTKSNKTKIIKTPGGVLRFQYRGKLGSGVSCSDCGMKLAGIKHLRPSEGPQYSKRFKTVTRAYGGNSCAECVKERIIRAFLIEEQKIVKRVMKSKENQKPAPEPEQPAKTQGKGKGKGKGAAPKGKSAPVKAKGKGSGKGKGAGRRR